MAGCLARDTWKGVSPSKFIIVDSGGDQSAILVVGEGAKEFRCYGRILAPYVLLPGRSAALQITLLGKM